MIPVPGFEELRIRWIEIRGHNFALYGFVLYSNADRQIIEFMEVGLPLLDRWSGPDTAIFLIEPPNEVWLRYMASQPGHLWHIFESASTDPGIAEENANTNLLIEHADKIMLGSDDDRVSLASVLHPNYWLPYDRLEVEQVRAYFGLAADEYPCIIFFDDLQASKFYYNPMPRFPDIQDVRYWFQRLFESSAFKSLLERTRLRGAGHGWR